MFPFAVAKDESVTAKMQMFGTQQVQKSGNGPIAEPGTNRLLCRLFKADSALPAIVIARLTALYLLR